MYKLCGILFVCSLSLVAGLAIPYYFLRNKYKVVKEKYKFLQKYNKYQVDTLEKV